MTDEELTLGRAAVTRGYPRNFETAEQIARAIAQLALYDLPRRLFHAVRADGDGAHARRSHARRGRHIHPDRLVAVVVGDPEKIGTSLAEAGLGVPAMSTLEDEKPSLQPDGS